MEKDMKKILAYSLWLIVSLAVLAVLRNIARYEFQEYSAIIMGVAFATVIYVFFLIRGRFSKSDDKPNK
jgi:hypothetical protein